MKKILCALLCVLALSACGSTKNTPAAQNVTEASAETEITSEAASAPVHNSDAENSPKAEEKREFKGEIIRVTSVDGNVITGEKISGGRGRPDGNAPAFDGEIPENGEPPAMPEDGSRPEGEMPGKSEKGDKAPNGERPQGEAVTFTVTDRTVMDIETISEGDMIIAELNEDGTAISVKAADLAKDARENETT